MPPATHAFRTPTTVPRASARPRIRQHTSAYVAAYVSIRSAARVWKDVSIRQHTSAYVSIRQHTSAYVAAYVSIRSAARVWKDAQ